MRYYISRLVVLSVLLFILIAWLLILPNRPVEKQERPPEHYWMVLHRKSQKELLFKGIPGDEKNSRLIKTFIVKSGIPGERPTPLPELLGRKYWIITEKAPTENPETAPYFLTLNIPAPSEPPYGPTPYKECNGPGSTQRGEQCDWILPGAFGLHGVNGDESRLSPENPGSSGCVRHSDKDIAYLYNILDPKKEEIRYYISDN